MEVCDLERMYHGLMLRGRVWSGGAVDRVELGGYKGVLLGEGG